MSEKERRAVQAAPRTTLPFFDRDLDDVFEGFFRPMRGASRVGSGPLMPALDVTEHDDHYLVHAELPGFRKEDIKVSVDQGQLSIEAETRSEEQGKGGRPVLRERRYGRFVRALNVGDNVDPAEISARYENGILEIKVPKPASKKPDVKHISID
ncbi:MAG: Hsp20/alpha crystallin family protein [Pseudomonadales bacterium]|nr:Hsp20/alpha crystallin family protein [Pseudomonadales bacterium]